MTVRKITGLMLGVAGVAIVVESQLAGGTSSALGIGFAVAALLSMGHAAFISQGVSGVSVAWRRLLQARSGPVFFRRNQPFAKVAPPRAVVACTGDQVRFCGEAEVDRQEKLANSVANDPNETRLPQNRCCARLPLNRFRRA